MSTPKTQSTPYLVALESGAGDGHRIPLSQDHLVVGRATGSDVRLDDEHVSRTHAILRQEDGRVWVQDLGSSGGTFVNGQSVTGPHELFPGDVVSFATVALRYAPDAVTDGEVTTMSRLDSRGGGPRRAGDTAPQVRYGIGGQSAGAISNVGRDQYHSYVQHVTQQRESFLREIAATRTKARWLVWSGFLLIVAGFGLFAGGVLGFIDAVGSASAATDPAALNPFGSEIAGVPYGIVGWATAALGMLLLILGIVLHVVATSRRRRVDREFRISPPPGYGPGQWGG
jgi:FHA domain